MFCMACVLKKIITEVQMSSGIVSPRELLQKYEQYELILNNFYSSSEKKFFSSS